MLNTNSHQFCIQQNSELSKNLQVLKESFINRDFNSKFLDTELKPLSEIQRDALLAPKSIEKDKRTPFVITYDKTLPNVKQIINKDWDLLQINSNLRTALEQGKKHIIAQLDHLGQNLVI